MDLCAVKKGRVTVNSDLGEVEGEAMTRRDRFGDHQTWSP